MESQEKPSILEKLSNIVKSYRLAVILAFAFLLIYLYSSLKYGTANLRDIIAMIIIIAVPIILTRFPTLRLWILSIIGERRPINRSSFRFLIIIPFVPPFVFYLLTSGVEESIPSALQWSIIAVAPTLGGLILAGASNRRIKRGAYFELISVVQKLIVATVFFILFTCLLFTVELTGGIDTNQIEWSLIGFFRGSLFWFSALFFYIGVYLFLVAIIDLVLSLRRLMI